MEVMITLAIVPLLLAVLFAVGVVRGRLGRDPRERRMFNASLAGFLALPPWFLALAGLFAQFFWATFASVAGVVWLIASGVMLAAAGVVGWGLVVGTRGRLGSAQPPH